MLGACNISIGHSSIFFGEGAFQIFAHFISFLKLLLRFYLFYVYVCALVQACALTHMCMS